MGFALLSVACLAALDAEISALFFPRITTQPVGQSFVVADPLMGYAPRPSVKAHIAWTRFGRVIYNADYSIDPHGHRLTKGSEDTAAPTVVFLGDSYSFGDGLNDADTLPQRFSEVTGGKNRVINAAFSGYGPGQVLALIQSGRLLGDLSSGPRLFIYPMIDASLRRIDPNALLHRVGTPHYALVNGQLLRLGSFHSGWAGPVVSLASKSAIVAGLRDLNLAAPSRLDATLFGAMTQAMAQAAGRDHHGRFLVLLWDEPVWQDGGSAALRRARLQVTKAMASEMTRRGVAFVRISTLIPDYRQLQSSYVLVGSGHPSAALNQRLAMALSDWLASPPGNGALPPRDGMPTRPSGLGSLTNPKPGKEAR